MNGMGTTGKLRAEGVVGIAWRKFVCLGRDEDGAALVMTLAMCLLMYLAVAAVFTAGTAIRERIHLQNAADAAAYSAVYNIVYIVGEAVIVVVLISIPAFSNALGRVKSVALQS